MGGRISREGRPTAAFLTPAACQASPDRTGPHPPVSAERVASLMSYHLPADKRTGKSDGSRMKINDAYTSGALAPLAERTGSAEVVTPGAENRQAATRAALQADRVHLSDLSDRLLKVSSAQSAERAARLERLSAEVQAGRYQADPLKVSRALIEETLKGG